MENLRAAIENDLAESMEGEWKIDVELTDPDGNVQTMSANDPTATLGGQVLYFSQPVDPITGEQTIVNMPVVSLRISSLDRVPANGEKWFIRMPISPVAGAEKVSFVFTGTKAKEHGTDIGFIRIYPQKIENENGPGSET
jgi:hypothetical protein